MENSITYRSADFEDLEELAWVARTHETVPEAWEQSYEIVERRVDKMLEFLKQGKTNPDVYCLLALDKNGSRVGLHWVKIVDRDDARVAAIQSLWVDPRFRRSGIAFEMKQRAEEWARSKDIKKIETHVFHTNEKMLALNAKLGFKLQHVRMEKEL